MMGKREFHPPHIYTDNACYFVTARIAGQQRILNTEAKRALVRNVLREAVVLDGIRLYAWVILADHYHLLLKTSQVAPLHKFIKRLHGQSAILLQITRTWPGTCYRARLYDAVPDFHESLR